MAGKRQIKHSKKAKFLRRNEDSILASTMVLVIGLLVNLPLLAMVAYTMIWLLFRLAPLTVATRKMEELPNL